MVVRATTILPSLSVDAVPDDETLRGNAHRRIVRAGQTVRRPTFPWSPVHVLLRHLESVGFPYSPCPLDVGDDVELLTYLDGESGPAELGKGRRFGWLGRACPAAA